MAICLILPCGLALTACGKHKHNWKISAKPTFETEGVCFCDCHEQATLPKLSNEDYQVTVVNADYSFYTYTKDNQTFNIGVTNFEFFGTPYGEPKDPANGLYDPVIKMGVNITKYNGNQSNVEIPDKVWICFDCDDALNYQVSMDYIGCYEATIGGIGGYENKAFKDVSVDEITIPATIINLYLSNFSNTNVTVYYKGNKSDLLVLDGNTDVYCYSDTAPSGVEYLDNNKIVDTWHYNESGEKVLWQPNFTTNVNDKTFNYSNSRVELSDTYWAMLKEAERQGVLGDLFDNDQDRINEVTSSNTKEEYEGKMATYYASTATTTSVSFAGDKLTLNTSAGSGQLDYVEVDGLVCCKVSGTSKVFFTYENGTIYEELSTEYYTIRHIYTLAE